MISKQPKTGFTTLLQTTFEIIYTGTEKCSMFLLLKILCKTSPALWQPCFSTESNSNLNSLNIYIQVTFLPNCFQIGPVPQKIVQVRTFPLFPMPQQP